MYTIHYLTLSKYCRDPGSNRGPLDLQSNALPTELSRLDMRKKSESRSLVLVIPVIRSNREEISSKETNEDKQLCNVVTVIFLTEFDHFYNLRSRRVVEF
jgi:hypothetical protein